MPISLDRLFWARTALLILAAGACAAPATVSAGGGTQHGTAHGAPAGLWDGYQAPCQRCNSSWQGYGAATCDCRPQRPRLILGLLDSVAGGVEHVLGLSGPRSGACDAAACDDGCDAMTQQLMQGAPRLVPVPSVGLPPQPPMMMGDPPPPAPGASQPRVIERVPTPPMQDENGDPFLDEQAGRRRINPAISPSAYFE